MNDFTFNKEELIENSKYNDYIKEFALLTKECEAYVYLRVSTKEQVENSPTAQLNDILSYCLEQNIYVAKENIFVDGGISGKYADKRTEFQRMINISLGKQNSCNAILVHKFDRFARNREESVIYKSKLKKAGIKVIAVKEPLPEDRKMALILENQLETNSELYSINLSDEVYKGLRIKAEDGKHMTKAPYGYKKVIKEIIKIRNRDKIIRDMIINEEEANIVRIIFEKFINGMSEYNIAIYLNNLGLTTREGHPWYDNRVIYILRNITYVGFAHWTELGKETISVKGDFPAIINQDTWDKSQAILNTRRTISDKPMKTQVKKEHWLRGKLRCSNCGNTLVINGGSFQCCAYTHAFCKESHSIKIEKMEQLVLHKFNNLTIDNIINININNIKIQNNDEMAIINDKLNQLKIKKERIMLAYENQIYSLEEFKERKEKILLEEENLNKRIKELKENSNFKKIQEKIYKRCDNIYNTLIDDNIPILDKQMLLNKAIDKIIFDKKNKTLEFFYKDL